MNVPLTYKQQKLHNYSRKVFASGQHKATEYYISIERKYPISASSYNNECANKLFKYDAGVGTPKYFLPTAN